MKPVEAELKVLLIRSLNGDAQAYAALLTAIAGFMRPYFARRLGGMAADVEDLVQETLLAIHLKRHCYDSRYPITVWVYSIARYKLLDHFRRAGARHSVPLDDADALFAMESAEEGIARRDLHKLLAQLPSRQREMLVDVKVMGLSMQEAAQKSGLSIAAVKVRIHRAIKALARMVADEDR